MVHTKLLPYICHFIEAVNLGNWERRGRIISVFVVVVVF